MTYTVLGIFSDRIHAESAIQDLETHGFDAKDISIMMKDHTIQPQKAAPSHPASKVTTGVATGGILGGVAGLLIGVGTIALPGIGALLVGGPLAVALGLTGAAASTVSGAALGALAGGLVGSLTALGVSHQDAQSYEYKIKEGGILLAIPVVENSLSEVKQILAQHQADMIRTVQVPQEPQPVQETVEERPIYQTEEVVEQPAPSQNYTRTQYDQHPKSVEETLKGWGQNIRSSFKDTFR